MSRQLHLRLTWQYLVAFAALTILCGTSHEFAHHFAGAAVCGAFGTKTFNSFELAPGCTANPLHLWPTLAGPALTFGLMWWGGWSCCGAPTTRGAGSASRSSSPTSRSTGSSSC